MFNETIKKVKTFYISYDLSTLSNLMDALLFMQLCFTIIFNSLGVGNASAPLRKECNPTFFP